MNQNNFPEKALFESNAQWPLTLALQDESKSTAFA